MTVDSIDPPEGLRLIKGRAFVDSPPDYPPEPYDTGHDCLETADDEPYIPNGKEWRDAMHEIARARTVGAMGIVIGAVGWFVAIVALAHIR